MSCTAISLKPVEDKFLKCYFAARPFEARERGADVGHTVLPLIDQAQIDELEQRILGLLGQLARIQEQAVLTEDQRLTCQLMEEIGEYEVDALRAAPQRYVVSPLPEAGLTSQLLVLLPQSSLSGAGASEEFRATCAATMARTPTTSRSSAGRRASG